MVLDLLAFGVGLQQVSLKEASTRILQFRNAVTRFKPLESLSDAAPATQTDKVIDLEVGVGGATLRLRDGAIVAYRSFGYISTKPSPLEIRLDEEGVKRVALRAYRLTGLPYVLKHVRTEDLGGDQVEMYFDLYDQGLKLAQCQEYVAVDPWLGEATKVYFYGSQDYYRVPTVPPSPRYDASLLPGAKAAVATAAFAEAKVRGRGAIDTLDASLEPEKGLWLAEPTRRGGYEAAGRAAGPTEAQLAAARDEGTPVWLVELRGDARMSKGEMAAFPIARGYVDASTGRLLWFQYLDGSGFGASPPPKPSPAPTLVGSAQLTANGRTRSVRLVPIAARPFAATGKAVLGLAKRIVEVEVDAKAGLVRYGGKLAKAIPR